MKGFHERICRQSQAENSVSDSEIPRLWKTVEGARFAAGEPAVTTDRESAGYLLGETPNLIRANAGLAFGALCVMTLLGVVSDLYPDFAGLAGFGSIVANLVFQYETTVALLVHYNFLDGSSRRRRLWALLGLNLLSGIAILFGLILLVLPGVYLLVRWSAAVPALIAEDSDISASFGLSAEAVAGRFWHVFAAMAVVWTPGLVGLLVSVMVPDGELLMASLILNLSLNVCLIAGWHLAVAIYAGRQDGRALAEVFA
ncbi:MAG TPA: hypothetical protein VF605_16960 [Allosphingosinicella sp.]